MSFNTLSPELQGFGAEDFELFASPLGEVAIQPLMDVDLESVANSIVPPQGENAPTAAFNSRMNQLAPAFQSNFAKV